MRNHILAGLFGYTRAATVAYYWRPPQEDWRVRLATRRNRIRLFSLQL